MQMLILRGSASVDDKNAQGLRLRVLSSLSFFFLLLVFCISFLYFSISVNCVQYYVYWVLCPVLTTELNW